MQKPLAQGRLALRSSLKRTRAKHCQVDVDLKERKKTKEESVRCRRQRRLEEERRTLLKRKKIQEKEKPQTAWPALPRRKKYKGEPFGPEEAERNLTLVTEETTEN